MQIRKQRTSRRLGITLMEVLASIFVLSIGLLGVVAVIPFGNFQVSKAREAEYCASMLAAAKADIKVSEMTMPVNWNNHGDLTVDGQLVFDYDATPADMKLDCRRFFVLDPLNPGNFASSNRFYTISFGNSNFWREFMRGQDELAYTTHEKYRPDFTEQNNSATSSGKFTWFCTFAMNPNAAYTGNVNSVPYGDWQGVTVDLLGCYNRVPGDNALERVISIPNTQIKDNYLNGVRMEFRSTNQASLDLAHTKYIFISWTKTGVPTTEMPIAGTWAKIISLSPADVMNGNDYVRELILMPAGGSFPASWATTSVSNIEATIIPGVLYHTTHACVLK